MVDLFVLFLVTPVVKRPIFTGVQQLRQISLLSLGRSRLKFNQRFEDFPLVIDQPWFRIKAHIQVIALDHNSAPFLSSCQPATSTFPRGVRKIQHQKTKDRKIKDQKPAWWKTQELNKSRPFTNGRPCKKAQEMLAVNVTFEL